MEPQNKSASALYKGIFWIRDPENIGDNSLCFMIPVNSHGEIDPVLDKTGLNSKNQDNYNHRKLWESLDSKVTGNKNYDYYPRGRIEIKNGKAIIFVSPHLCRDDIIEWVTGEFHLNEQNGIKTVRVVPDYSIHYRCYLDDC